MERTEIFRLLGEGPDWDGLEARAEDEGTAPLVHWNLRNLAGAVSGRGPERFKTQFLRNVGRNVRLYSLLEPFLEKARRSGARVALTKGSRLALTVYPDPGLRPFGDVDCIVHPRDWPAVETALEKTGFRKAAASGIRPDLSDPKLHWTFSPYYRKEDLLVEIHFNYLGLHFPFGSEKDLWDSAGGQAVLGSSVAILSNEYELCTLSLHAQQHSYRKLMWLSDIAALVSRSPVGWDKVASICHREKIRSSVSYALHLVETVWPGSVPREALTSVSVRPASWRALRFMWPERDVSGRVIPAAWPYYMPTVLSLWERKNPALALRTLAAILFPPRTWMGAVSGPAGRGLRIAPAYLRRILRPAGLAVKRILSR